MVIWRIEGDEIGPNGNGAAHYPTKAEAEVAIREYKSWRLDQYADDYSPLGPYKIVVKSREHLCSALNEAMGFGCT